MFSQLQFQYLMFSQLQFQYLMFSQLQRPRYPLFIVKVEPKVSVGKAAS